MVDTAALGAEPDESSMPIACRRLLPVGVTARGGLPPLEIPLLTPRAWGVPRGEAPTPDLLLPAVEVILPSSIVKLSLVEPVTVLLGLDAGWLLMVPSPSMEAESCSYCVVEI